MKAIRVAQFGGPEVLRLAEIPDPIPGPGEVLVRLHAAGINPVETYIRSGKYGKLPDLPYTPGSDGAGRVEALGSNVAGLQAGDRIYVAGSSTGTYAQLCLCKAGQVHPLPAAYSFYEGAGLGVPYATAHHALFERAQAQAGETVLIHGGTGGVGLAALQYAKAAGLTVFATGGSEPGRVLLYEQGADAIFDHLAIGYDEQIREQTGGRGVDVIPELLANVNLSRDLGLLAPRERVAVVGSRGPIEINPREIMTREADIRGVVLSSLSPEALGAIPEQLGKALEKGLLHHGDLPPISTRRSRCGARNGVGSWSPRKDRARDVIL